MHIMTKNGEKVNVATYEHFCDTLADMKNIDSRNINLGSICAVIHGTNDTLELYIADSNKQWNLAYVSDEAE